MNPTREEITNATNEHLNVWVAEYVMGLLITKKTVRRTDDFSFRRRVSYYNIVEIWAGNGLLRDYTGSISAAWEVVETVDEKGYPVEIDTTRPISCTIHKSENVFVFIEADNLRAIPRAICIAALLAVLEL